MSFYHFAQGAGRQYARQHASRFASGFSSTRFMSNTSAAQAAAFLRSRSPNGALPSLLVGQHCSLLTPGAITALQSTQNGLTSMTRELSTQAGGEGDPADSYGSIIEVDSDADFEAILVKLPRNDTLTIIDFHAAWCGPCKMLGPALIKECKEQKIQLIKVDVDGAGETATKFQVTALPTVIAYKNGEVIQRMVGAQPPPMIKKFIETFK